jgi:peptidylprolyl isomerase
MKESLVIGLLLLACLGLAGCGGSESTGGSTGTSEAGGAAEEKPAAAPPEEAAPPGEWTPLKRVAGPYSNRLLIPSGPAPEQVIVRDLKVGKGPVLQKNDNFLTRYLSLTYDDAYPIEPYWGAPSTYTFELGSYKKGWEVGLRGIRVGGMRELIVPSEMAYGEGARVYVIQALKLG